MPGSFSLELAEVHLKMEDDPVAFVLQRENINQLCLRPCISYNFNENLLIMGFTHKWFYKGR